VMKENKFRAWDGEDMQTNLGCVLLSCLEEGVIETPDGEDVIDCVYMQYTGIEDKNEVDVYEGDIVSLYEHRYRGDGSYDDSLAVVEWDDDFCGFVFKLLPREGGDSEAFLFENIIEVLGNIYENPELLEQA
jgi:uncharacterized phage protein (TIGR01671 family)